MRFFKFLFFIAFSVHVSHAAGLGLSFIKANAANPNDDKRGWELDLNRISLNFSQATITNQNLYSDFSDSNLKGNSQLSLQFFFTFNASYYARRFVIFNSIYSEYGFTEIRKENADPVTNKNLDKFVLSTDYTQRVWDFDWGFESFEMGPYLKLAYQTDFNPTPEIGRRQIFMYVLGAKLFDGIYIKNFYLNMFGEHDVNPNIALNSIGMETGLGLEYKFSKNIKWSYSMNFKQYLFNAQGSLISPQYQLLLETRIDAKLFRNFSVAPMLRYYMLKAEDKKMPATNLLLGVSFTFGKVLMPPNQVAKGVYDFSN